MGRITDLTDYIDVIIVGGGIVGAGIFRDLSLHNINCLLIDRGDFASQTSQKSSKMLHGGIRYLENFDFPLIQKALKEKNLWLKIAPHLAQEQAFLLPVFKETKYPLWVLRLGLYFYDFLSGFQNSPCKTLSKKDTLLKIPHLKDKNLVGAGMYFDAIVDDAKLTLACITDALTKKNAVASNYTEIISFQHLDDLCHIEIRDTKTSQSKVIKCRELIFATGPFTDQLMHKIGISPWEDKLILSAGAHIWIKKTSLELNYPIVLQTKDQRIIFVIPHKDAILAGTTETPIASDQDIFDFKATQHDIKYILDNVNEYFLRNRLSERDVISSFAGVRPLVKESSTSNLGQICRDHKVFRPHHNVHVIVGGKLTTFRTMAQEITAPIVTKLAPPYCPFKTTAKLNII